MIILISFFGSQSSHRRIQGLSYQNNVLNSSYFRISVCHMRWKTPAFRHSLKRSWIVLEIPKLRGISFHLQPVCNTYSIPSIAFLSSICGGSFLSPGILAAVKVRSFPRVNLRFDMFHLHL